MLGLAIPPQLSNCFVLSLALYCPVSWSLSSCNTNENPYCRGVAAFQGLCCNYPDRCYYANRYGEVGCCPYGENCAGATNPGQVTQSTVYPPGSVITLTTDASPSEQPTTQITSTITEDGPSPDTTTNTQGGIIGTITSYAGGAVETATSAAGEVYSTVSGILVGGADQSEVPRVFISIACLMNFVVALVGG